MMPDPQTDDVINYLLQKADQSLESAQSEFQAKRFDFAVNRAYYACFYSASAIMLQRGKQFVKHAGLRSAMVDVAERQVIAFAVAECGSRQIRVSGVLPVLELALVEDALGRWSKTGPEGPSQTEDDTTLMRWLMEAVA